MKKHACPGPDPAVFRPGEYGSRDYPDLGQTALRSSLAALERGLRRWGTATGFPVLGFLPALAGSPLPDGKGAEPREEEKGNPQGPSDHFAGAPSCSAGIRPARCSRGKSHTDNPPALSKYPWLCRGLFTIARNGVTLLPDRQMVVHNPKNQK